MIKLAKIENIYREVLGALISLGFAIEKAPGAPGKREMLRAVKLV